MAYSSRCLLCVLLETLNIDILNYNYTVALGDSCCELVAGIVAYVVHPQLDALLPDKRFGSVMRVTLGASQSTLNMFELAIQLTESVFG